MLQDMFEKPVQAAAQAGESISNQIKIIISEHRTQCFSSSFLSADSPAPAAAAAESVLTLQRGNTTVWEINFKKYLSNGSKMLKRRK